MSVVKQPHQKYILAGLLLATLILFAPADGESQVTVELPVGPTASPIEMTLSPLPAAVNLREYQALAEKLSLGRTKEMITIMVLTIHNTANIVASTTLGDIAALTGTERHLFVAYLQESPLTGKPTYFLPDWTTPLAIGGEQSIALRLAFILKKGEHAVFENTVRVYACFSHAVFKGVYHSVSVSRRNPMSPRWKSLRPLRPSQRRTRLLFSRHPFRSIPTTNSGTKPLRRRGVKRL